MKYTIELDENEYKELLILMSRGLPESKGKGDVSVDMLTKVQGAKLTPDIVLVAPQDPLKNFNEKMSEFMNPKAKQ